MTEKRFTLHKGLDTLNIMDNTKFNEQIYINKSHKDMKLLVGLLNRLAEENNELKDKMENGLCPLCGARVSKCGGLQKYKGDFDMTEKRSCGHCKYLQIDGMFGMWCDRGRNWEDTDADYCSDYER